MIPYVEWLMRNSVELIVHIACVNFCYEVKATGELSSARLFSRIQQTVDDCGLFGAGFRNYARPTKSYPRRIHRELFP
jgi:hypothetical protein